MKHGKIEVLETNPKELKPESVVLDVKGKTREIPNDYVWILQAASRHPGSGQTSAPGREGQTGTGRRRGRINGYGRCFLSITTATGPSCTTCHSWGSRRIKLAKVESDCRATV